MPVREHERSSILMREPTEPKPRAKPGALRAAFGCGIAYALIQLGAVAYMTRFVLADKPGADATALRMAAFHVRNADSILLGNWLLVLPLPFFLIFLAGLFIVLRQAERTGVFSVATLASGVAVAVLWPLGAYVSDMAVAMARTGGDPAVIQAMDMAAPWTLALTSLPRAVLLGAAGIVLWRYELVARWIPATGLILAPLLLIGSAATVAPGAFPFAAFGSAAAVLWTLVLSIALIRK